MLPIKISLPFQSPPLSYKGSFVSVHTAMFYMLLYDLRWDDPFVYDDEIIRGVSREYHWRLVCDVSTNTPDQSGIHHPYAHEWDELRPWVQRPLLDLYCYAYTPCVRLLQSPTHADAQTQTPSATDIDEFILAFCMGKFLDDNLLRMIIEYYIEGSYDLFSD